MYMYYNRLIIFSYGNANYLYSSKLVEGRMNTYSVDFCDMNYYNYIVLLCTSKYVIIILE
jgi:hypothetical protein